MPRRRRSFLALLPCGVLCMLIGAGSVFAAASRPVAASALADYDSATADLKRTDLARALVSDGASPDRIVVSYAHGSVDQTTLDRVHELASGTWLLGSHA